MEFAHVPVLPLECMEGLAIKPNGVYLDGTTGGGGHSYLIASRLTTGRLICVDRDSDALAAAKARLAPLEKNITYVKSNFCDIAGVTAEYAPAGLDGLLLDLGVSSYQLDNPSRGFSYMNDAPLDMRMDAAETLTAFDVVNTYDVSHLSNVIEDYGEERFAWRIANAIATRRDIKPIETTAELVDIIKSAMPAAAKREKQHPAKRTFQAIRIEVNGELQAVRRVMEIAPSCMSKGGRIAVISFHSLEDRLIKQGFSAAATGCTCPKEFPVCVCGKKPIIKLITKGVITAPQSEQEENPRARSAKLRVAEKL